MTKHPGEEGYLETAFCESFVELLRPQHGGHRCAWHDRFTCERTEFRREIRAGRLFDSKTGRILENQIVLVEGERISSVGSADQVQIPAGAQVIDLSKATVLPGLIDGHTHVFGFGLDGIKPGGPPFASPINDPRYLIKQIAMAKP